MSTQPFTYTNPDRMAEEACDMAWRDFEDPRTVAGKLALENALHLAVFGEQAFVNVEPRQPDPSSIAFRTGSFITALERDLRPTA